jgi:hypothetical protein
VAVARLVARRASESSDVKDDADMMQGDFDFSGATYERQFDQGRLNAQLQRVYACMRDGVWRTLGEISATTADPPASVSARLRDLRKKRFGEHTVERRARGDRQRRLFEYRLLVRTWP